MSFRELTMIEVKEVARRWQAGQAQREMSRETGLDRKTVRRYVEALREFGLTAEAELDDQTVHAIAQLVQLRPVAERSPERAKVSEHRALIESWLSEKRPLRMSKIWTLLTRDYGLEASYATLRRYAMDELGWHHKKPTVRIADAPPGEEAQVDFGLMGELTDSRTGEVRKLHALVVTLCFSRHQFVWPTFEQTTEAVCDGLDAAWRFFGGKALRIIPDNASSMVSKANRLEPTINSAFADYAQARDLFIDAARVRQPKDKGRVENQIAYVRESWWAGERLGSLGEARSSAAAWCSNVAGKRVHGTTREQPIALFECEELGTLRPAPTERFDVPHWGKAKVHPDHHVQVQKALYSLPTKYIGREVRVRADSMTVRIYLATELIKTHGRVGPGKRSTDPNDYPDSVAPFAMRRIDALLLRAKQRGEHIGLYAERLLGGPLPWTTMRQGYELIRLCDRYGEQRVDVVCRRSLEFDVIDVPRIGRMLKQAMRIEDLASQSGNVRKLPETPRFARAKDGFSARSEVTS